MFAASTLRPTSSTTAGSSSTNSPHTGCTRHHRVHVVNTSDTRAAIDNPRRVATLPRGPFHSHLADLILVFTHHFSESLVNPGVAEFQLIDPQSHALNQRPKLFAPANRVDLLRRSPQ